MENKKKLNSMLYTSLGKMQKSIFLEQIDEREENRQPSMEEMKTNGGDSSVNIAQSHQFHQAADSDYHRFQIEKRQFLLNGEITCTLLIFNQFGREILKGIFTAQQFQSFLGFLKAKAKFQKKFPDEILLIPSNEFTVEVVQKVFSLLEKSKFHQQEDFLQKTYLPVWRAAYEKYNNKISQKTLTLNTVRDKMENIEQKIKRLPVNELNNMPQIYIGLEKNSDFLENENNQSKIKNVIQTHFRYQLKELIGKGAYGLVYAIDLDHNQNQAIKIQINQSSNAAEFKKCEELQNYALSSLEGDILHFFKCFQVQDTYSKEILDFFIMERGEKNLKQLTQASNSGDFNHYWNKQEIRNLFMGIMRNVVFLHSCNYYHRDIKYDNIIKKRQTYYLIDFNVSEKIEQVLPLAVKLDKAQDRATLRKQDVLSGTPGYLTPQWDMKYQEIKAQKDDPNKKNSRNDWMGIHDPFKSDLYSLGVVFVQFLNNVKLRQYENNQKFIPSKDAKKCFPLAHSVSETLSAKEKIKVNQYFTPTHQFLMGDKIYEVENLLVKLLEPKETDRISTLKLSLICQLFSAVVNNYVNLYPEHFPPEEFPKINEFLYQQGEQINTQGSIKYKFKNQEYQGDYICVIHSNNRKVFIREGYGELYEYDQENQGLRSLVYIGRWKNDLPHGEGKYHFFSGNFQYIGEFQNGVFHGKGTIFYNNPIIEFNSSSQTKNIAIPHLNNNNTNSQAYTLGLSAPLAVSQLSYQTTRPTAASQTPQQYTSVKIYQGIFYNFILKDWLIEEGDILEEDCKYQIRLNASKDEQPLYATILNAGKKRIIEMTMKAFKNFGKYLHLFQSSRFDSYELNLIQDDCVNGIAVGLIYGPFNTVTVFFESYQTQPIFSIEDYVQLILFAKRVQEINFDFAKSDNSWSLEQLLENQGVKECIYECKVMRSVYALNQGIKNIIKNFPFLQEIDLSFLGPSDLMQLGADIEAVKSSNKECSLKSIAVNFYHPDADTNLNNQLFSNYAFGNLKSLDLSNSEIPGDALIRLFQLPQSLSLRNLNIQYCSQLNDQFFMEWNSLRLPQNMYNTFQQSTYYESFQQKFLKIFQLNQSNKDKSAPQRINYCLKLESLNISGIYFEKPENLALFLSKAVHLSTLQELIMSGMHNITDLTIKNAFKQSNIFCNNLQKISLAYNDLITYKCMSYLMTPRMMELRYINVSYCNLFEVDEFVNSDFPKLKISKNLAFLDLSNSGDMDDIALEFLSVLQKNNYVLEQIKLSLNQIDKDFTALFLKGTILSLLSSVCIYYDPAYRFYESTTTFLSAILQINKKVLFVTEMNEKSEQQLSVILSELFQDSQNLMFINDEPVPLEKYCNINTQIFNEIQLLGKREINNNSYNYLLEKIEEMPMHISFKGSIQKLIRHEKFKEKTELDLSKERGIGSEIIDSLVISDNCGNLRILDLSNSIISDGDLKLFCTNGQFAITTIILNNCICVTEKGINQLITAKNNPSLNKLQLKGIYRDLGSIQLYDVNSKEIVLELDRISLTHIKTNKSETLKYKEVLETYLSTHCQIFEKMRIQALDYKILKVFNSFQLNYPQLNTLHLDLSSVPFALHSIEAKHKAVEELVQLLVKVPQIHHLVLDLDELFVSFLAREMHQNKPWVVRLSQALRQLEQLLSIHFKQEWSDPHNPNRFLTEDLIESVHIFLLQSISLKVSKLSFKLNMYKDQFKQYFVDLKLRCIQHQYGVCVAVRSEFMWNILKKERLTDICVLNICKAIERFTNLECLTLQLGGWGHQNSGITTASISSIAYLIAQVQSDNFRKINLDLSYWGSKNLNMDLSCISQLFQSIQLQSRMVSIQMNFAGWGQNLQVSDALVRDVFSKIAPSTLGFSSVMAFSMDVSDWSDLSYSSQIEIIDFVERSFQSLSELSLNLSEWNSKYICINSQVIQKISQMLKKKKELRSLSLFLAASKFGNNVQLTTADVKQISDSIESLQHLETLSLAFNGWGEDITISGASSLTSAITTLTKLKTLHLELKNWPQFNESIADTLQTIAVINESSQEQQQQQKIQNEPRRNKQREISLFMKTSQEEIEGAEADLKQFIRNVQQLVSLSNKRFKFDGWGSMKENIDKMVETQQTDTVFIPSYQTTEKTHHLSLQ